MFNTPRFHASALNSSAANPARQECTSALIAMELMEPRLLLSAAPFLPAVNYTTGAEPYQVVSGDFNHDGKRDLATVNDSSTLDPGSISILLGNGDGTFKAKTDIATDIDPMALVVGDFNNDGIDDLAVANATSNTVDIFLSNGDGTFQAKKSFSTGTGSGPQCLAVGDFDRDGNRDLAVGMGSADQVVVYLGNGSGGFSKKTTLTVTNPVSIAVADFNFDGKKDLVIVQQGSDSVRIVYGKGDATFLNGSTLSYATGGTPTAVAFGDFSHNSSLDLAVTSYSDKTVSVLEGAAGGTFQSQVTFPTGLDPQSVAVGDLNMDGSLDLAIANWGDDTVSVLLGDGRGSFQATASDLDVQSGARSVIVDDFNGDGLEDLAVSNAGSNSVSVLLGTGPRASNFARTINEGTTLTFSAAIFTAAYSDPAGLKLQGVLIDEIATHGTLKLKGVDVVPGQVIPVAQLGYLTFTFPAGFAGTSQFGWQAYDGVTYSAYAHVDVWTTPKATIVSNGNATEGGAGSTFTVSLNVAAAGDLTIPLVVGGTARAGKNYTALPKTVTIPAGQTSAAVTVAPLFDGLATGNLSLIARIGNGKGYLVNSPYSATMTILDNAPKVSIVSNGTATEGGAGNTFTINLSAPAPSDLTIPLVVGGTARAGKNYTALPKSVSVLTGQTSATVTLTPLVDNLATGNLSVIARLALAKGYSLASPSLATMTLVDTAPKLSVTASPATTTFGAAAGAITFTRTGPTDQSFTFTITIRGTARAGTDYTAVPTTVTIPALQSSATVNIVPLVNVATTKTVTVSINPSKAFTLDPLAHSVLVSILHTT